MAIIGIVILFSTPAAVADSLDASFNPDANGTVRVLAVQADGKILVGGDFDTIGGQTRNGIARLNADGTLDTSFNPSANGSVRSLVVQADGKILVGGSFDIIGGQTRNRLARLNSDGMLDSTFNPNVTGGLVSRVNTLAVQADGKILLGGGFDMVGGQIRNRIARINADGTLDASFDPGASGTSVPQVFSLAVQTDGKIVMVGNFTTIGEHSRNRIARISSDGTVDTTFNPNGDGSVQSLLIQANGKILVGGLYSRVGGHDRRNIARINVDGTLDIPFNPESNTNSSTFAEQADGKILVGGYFNTMSGQARSRIARLNPNGTLDTTFDPNAGDAVLSLVVQADGKILVGGSFDTIGGQDRNRIARLNAPSAANRPTIRIKGRKTIRTTRSRHTVRGTASDKDGNLATVKVRSAKDNKFRPAKGLANWRYTARLRKGRNVIKAYAQDTTERRSQMARITVIKERRRR